MKNKEEFIICAAFHYDDGKKYPHQPENIGTGIVIAGYRHHNCITTAASLLGLSYNKNLCNRDAQGFLTSFNRYVNRKEGFRIALTNDQIIHNFYDKADAEQILVSEDLY
jgi:hypothetical protein